MEKEAKAATKKAAESAAVAAAREEGQTENARGSALVEELELSVKDAEAAIREHQLRRAKMVVRINAGLRLFSLVLAMRKE